MSLIQKGIEEKLISLSDDHNTITYLYQKKKRNYRNPEEKVQAETFLKLVLEYGYPVEHIEQFKKVTMGSSSKEADIIVHENEDWNAPKIVVECKRQDVSEQEYKQAINQAFSYASALTGTVKFIWVTSNILNEWFKFDKEKETREVLGQLPAYGFDEVAPYNFVKGGGEREYLNNKGKKQTQRFQDLKVVSENELTGRFKQAHNALWAGGQLNPSEAFDELDKLIFCKIWDEKYNLEDGTLKGRKKGEIYDFQVITLSSVRKTNEALAKRIRNIYKAGRTFDKEVFKDDIRLSDQRIRTIVGYLQEINLSATDLDSKGRAFETFMGSFFRGEFGQYFTPRVIVQFIVESLPIKNTSLVLDTSCGSGGFLLHALDKVRRKANEEFPDYNTDIEEHNNWKDYWHSFAENNLYGIEINEQIARTAKMNMIIHDDGHTNVISIDGLVPLQINNAADNETKEQKDYRLQLNDISIEKYIQENGLKTNGFKNNTYDFIITNPPFGSKIKSNEKAYLKNYTFGKKQVDWLDFRGKTMTYRTNQSTEVLFIEQCYNFLKEDGYLAVVLPDSILTNSSLQYVRDQIEDWYRLVAVISLPQTAFSATGAGVKSSILFIKKYNSKKTNEIQRIKFNLQEHLKNEYNYIDTVKKWYKKRNKIVDAQENGNFTYADRIKEFQEELNEQYHKRKATALKDYPIFMAIAENIGYDATGKSSSILINKEQIIDGNYKTIIEHLSHDLFDEKHIKKYDIQGDEIGAKKVVLNAGILKELSHFIKQVENGSI